MQSIIGEWEISEQAPDSYESTELSLSDVFNSTKKFMDEHFKGAVEVIGAPTDLGIALVSPEGLVHFIKRVLLAVFGKSLLKIRMDATAYCFKIILSWNSNKRLGKEEMGELERIARLSSFEISLSESKDGTDLILNLKTHLDPALYIYAKNQRYLFSVFCDLFFKRPII